MTPLSASRDATPITRALLTEAIRLIESTGPLDDGQALRLAAAHAGPAQEQIALRAASLAQRLQLPQRLQRAHQLAPWVLLGIAVCVLASGWLLASSVVDVQARHINLMAALAALLGLHLLTLLLWLLALLWPGAGIWSGGFMGRAWVQLTARLALGRGTENAALTQGGLHLLERARLTPWLLGLASHAVWSLAFAAVLGGLVFAFSFRQYTLGWESTLFDPAVFAQAVQNLALVPGWLGFARPDPVQPSQQQLAHWLIGCVLGYGLLPRLLCALACLAMWQRGRSRLQPDWSAPYYRQLITRLDALAPAVVVDADSRAAGPRPAWAPQSTPTGQHTWLVGFELPPEWPWPPTPLPLGFDRVMQVDGSAAQRQALLNALTTQPARLLLLACQAASSPDRGTERLLRELLPWAGSCRLWLLGSNTSSVGIHPDSAARWRQWLADIGLADAVPCFGDAAAALNFTPPTAP